MLARGTGMTAMRRSVANYLVLRRAMGFRLRKVGLALEDFASFMERQQARHITTELALRWAQQPANVLPARWAYRLAIVRRFAEHHCALDVKTEIPPLGLLPHRYSRGTPYIYTSAEIERLMRCSGELSSTTGLRPHTYSTLVGLLAVTGMRVGECIALDRADVDFVNGLLTVRQSKLGRSRHVPVHPSTREALWKYSQQRDRIYPNASSPSFFVSDLGTRLTDRVVEKTFVRLARRADLKTATGRRRPRLHDLRHTFAVQALLRWYRAGIDAEPRLIELSTYLGHKRIASTYWYITAVPELLRLAVDRARGLGRPVSQ